MVAKPIQSTPESTLPPNQSDATQSTRTVNVGGWLLFFCVSLTILSPLAYLAGVVQWLKVLPMIDSRSVKLSFIWESIGGAAIATYGFLTGYQIWRGHPKGRELAKRFLVIALLAAIGVAIVGTMIVMTDATPEVAADTIGDEVINILRLVVCITIWWLYFKKSKRVKNTYGPDGT